jgi:DNA-binding protein Fis
MDFKHDSPLFRDGRLPDSEEAPAANPPVRPDRILDHITDVLVLLLTEQSLCGLSHKRVFEALEKKLLVKVLDAFEGHQEKAAAFLHLLPTTLSAKMKKHGIVRIATASKPPTDPAARRLARSPRRSAPGERRRKQPVSDETREFRPGRSSMRSGPADPRSKESRT